MKTFFIVIIGFIVLFAYSVFGQGTDFSPFRLSGTAIVPKVGTWTLGSSSNRLDKGWFDDFDTTTITIGSFASGNLTTSGDLFVNGADINLGTGSATTTLTASSTAFAITANATTTLGTTGFNVGSGQFVVQQTSGNVGIGTTSPQAKLELGSGQIFMPNGLVETPSYSFSNDTNLGFFRQSDDQIGVAINGELDFLFLNDRFDLRSDSAVLNWGLSQDVSLSRGAANRLDLASGDSFIVVSGNVGIGTTSPWRRFAVVGTMAVNGLSGGGAGDDDVCMNPTSFDITDANASTCIVSSLRFKENISPQKNAMSAIMSLNPVTFTYKPELDHSRVKGQMHYGLIAEEVEKVVQELVGYEDDNVTPRTVRYEEMVSLLVRGMQEQQKQIEELKRQVGITNQCVWRK